MKLTLVAWLVLILLPACTLGQAVKGCTDRQATNFNPQAVENDGSCLYATTTISPDTTLPLPDKIKETSGLIYWDNYLWTHNDNSDAHLYALDRRSAIIVREQLIPGGNKDWEEISQDETYIYIGDIGNNARGNRKDLHILKLEKSQLPSSSLIDSISFYYPGQDSFEPVPANSTNFDCEAFVVSRDSIYLFTKQWQNLYTSLYVIPNRPGRYEARLKDRYAVNGLITGATLLPEKKLVVLCGYDKLLQPFILTLYDFKDHDFFSGNKRKINLNLPFHQVEGICTENGLQYFVSNEAFSKESINIPPRLHILDLSAYLKEYLSPSSSSLIQNHTAKQLHVYPNPSPGWLHIELTGTQQHSAQYNVLDTRGRSVKNGTITGSATIQTGTLPAGLYYIRIPGIRGRSFQVL